MAYDIAAHGPAAAMAPSRGLLAGALVIGPLRAGSRELAWRIEAESAEPSAARPANAALVYGNAIAPCLPVFEALAADTPASLVLRLSEGSTLHLDIGAASA